jgi:hypothetical protein
MNFLSENFELYAARDNPIAIGSDRYRIVNNEDQISNAWFTPKSPKRDFK